MQFHFHFRSILYRINRVDRLITAIACNLPKVRVQYLKRVCTKGNGAVSIRMLCADKTFKMLAPCLRMPCLLDNKSVDLCGSTGILLLDNCQTYLRWACGGGQNEVTLSAHSGSERVSGTGLWGRITLHL
jgi:hypothetical protein